MCLRFVIQHHQAFNPLCKWLIMCRVCDNKLHCNYYGTKPHWAWLEKIRIGIELIVYWHWTSGTHNVTIHWTPHMKSTKDYPNMQYQKRSATKTSHWPIKRCQKTNLRAWRQQQDLLKNKMAESGSIFAVIFMNHIEWVMNVISLLLVH